jgi:cytochrome c oxidase cbb3-type subunit 3
MDDVWIYGSEPANIYATIVEGRPNGMPSFGGHIPDEQVWQLVAYVRSMSGLVPQDAAPSRNDDIQSKPSENRADPQAPAMAAPPASAERSQ